MSEYHCDRCDVAMKVMDKGWHPVAGRLVVESVSDEDEATRWEFVMVDGDSRRPLEPEEMEEIAWLVEQAEEM